MSGAIWGIAGVVIGTILGWGLNLLTNVLGKIDIVQTNCFCTFRNLNKNKEVPFYENPNDMKINLNLRVSNFKGKTIGLNGCDIELVYEDISEKFIDINNSDPESDLGDNLEDLINIPANYTKNIYFRHNIFHISHPEKLKNGYKIIMIYHINGKKKEYRKVLLDFKP